MQGITAYELRVLCDNPWNGGGGYTPQEVAQMTLDQIVFRLCDMKLLRSKIGERTQAAEAAAVLGAVRPGEDGLYAGKAADGTVIRARIGGKSWARRLMEQQEQQKRERKSPTRKDREPVRFLGATSSEKGNRSGS